MNASRRQALADFLRSRREQLTPEAIGLPVYGRRRTPGLRREEVAALAGVGLTWYTWLEQGRQINASEQVLLAVGQALRLNRTEQNHLFELAGLWPKSPKAAPAPAVTEEARLILELLLPYSALLINERLDILAYNRAFRHLFGDVEEGPPRSLNVAELLFTDPQWQAGHVFEFMKEARILVGELRFAMSGHLNDPLWTGFVDRLRRQSPIFDELWEDRIVHYPTNHHDVLVCPHVGQVEVLITFLRLGSAGTAQLVFAAPSDDATKAKFRELDAMFAQSPSVTVCARP